jgi:hypothetical protein
MRLREAMCLYVVLDASKAFDRVNHWTLYSKLLDRGVPTYIVRILKTWYASQLLCVRWGTATSTLFNVSNGVRQGSVMSPRTKMYLKLLSESGVGCNIGGTILNNFSCADDISLVCPSVSALRKLISICEMYDDEHDIIYNAKKTVCMFV